MTPKQEKLINLISENLGNPENTRTLGELMLEAGYSESMSKSPYQIIGSETIQEGIKPIIDQLEEIRQKAIVALKEKDPTGEPYKDIASVLDTITKNIQLLSDKPTEINKNQEVELLRQQLKEWIKPNETNV